MFFSGIIPFGVYLAYGLIVRASYSDNLTCHPIICRYFLHCEYTTCLFVRVENKRKIMGGGPLRKAIQEGDLEKVEALYEENGKSWSTSVCNMAVEYHQLSILQFLHSKQIPWDDRTTNVAAEFGYLDILKYLVENKCRVTKEAGFLAAKGGHLECLKYLHEQQAPWDPELYKYAVMSNRVDSVQFLFNTGLALPNFSIINIAAKEGNLEMIILLRDKGCKWHESTCKEAAKHGHLTILQYLHANGCPWDQYAHYEAVINNHQACIDFLNKHMSSMVPPYPYNSLKKTACSKAARLKDWNDLKQLHEHGYEWGADTCTEVARLGNVDMLQYLHENGCPWNEETLAACTHDEDCLEYALANQCPGGSSACIEAARCGKVESLETLLEHNYDIDMVEALTEAASNGHVDCLQLLCDKNEETETSLSTYDQKQICDAAFDHHEKKCLQYLLAKGFYWVETEFDWENRHLY